MTTAAGVRASASLDRRVRREAKGLLRDGAKAARRGGRITAEERAALQRHLTELEQAVDKSDYPAMRRLLPPIDAAVDKVAAQVGKSPVFEYGYSIGTALVIALFLRAFSVEAFRIPSASMIPTMQIGDFIFVNKLIYGLRMPFSDYKLFAVRKPRRGEVIVFRQPCMDDTDFIKRVVAVAGDKVELRCNALYINGQQVPETLEPGTCTYWDTKSGQWTEQPCSAYRETLDGKHFTIHHAFDWPREAAIAAQGWPAFWREHQARRMAEGATAETIELERAAMLDEFPAAQGRTGEFPNSHDPANAAPRCPEARRVEARSIGKIERTAPEPDPQNPTCGPRLHYVVPPGYVFAMGDNRDDSNDSRAWGPVPVENIKGKAMFIWLSLGPHGGWVRPFGMRWDRIGNLVH